MYGLVVASVNASLSFQSLAILLQGLEVVTNYVLLYVNAVRSIFKAYHIIEFIGLFMQVKITRDFRIFISAYNLWLLVIWEARTRHWRCRTRVRRGGTRRRAGDVAAHASGRVLPRRATWFSPTHADAASTRADSSGIGPTRA